MKLTKRLGCCDNGINKSIIIKDDEEMFDDFVYFLNKIKKHIVDSIKCEYFDGDWVEYSYDDNGNQIKYKDSDNDWEKYTYDDKGNKIKYENSAGVWVEYSYDDNGNQIKYIKSNGY